MFYDNSPFVMTWMRYNLLCPAQCITRPEAVILMAQETCEEAFWDTTIEVYKHVARLRYRSPHPSQTLYVPFEDLWEQAREKWWEMHNE